METTEIAAELRKRAEEMRQLPPGVWVDHGPIKDGQECAIRRGRCEMSNYVLSHYAIKASDRWLRTHDIADYLTTYNDKIALDQFDVANVLDKIAEDITAD